MIWHMSKSYILQFCEKVKFTKCHKCDNCILRVKYRYSSWGSHYMVDHVQLVTRLVTLLTWRKNWSLSFLNLAPSCTLSRTVWYCLWDKGVT